MVLPAARWHTGDLRPGRREEAEGVGWGWRWWGYAVCYSSAQQKSIRLKISRGQRRVVLPRLYPHIKKLHSRHQIYWVPGELWFICLFVHLMSTSASAMEIVSLPLSPKKKYSHLSFFPLQFHLFCHYSITI